MEADQSCTWGLRIRSRGSNCNEIRAFIGIYMPYQELMKMCSINFVLPVIMTILLSFE